MKERYDLREVMLGATADIEGVLREVMRDLIEPQMTEQIGRIWADMPEEMKTQFAEESPEEYRALMELLDG